MANGPGSRQRSGGVTRRAALAAGLGTVASASALARTDPTRPARGPLRIGVALGGGGAKGLGHLVVCEALEELGVTPTVMAGTSAGALFGALIASGRSCASIRRRIRERFLADAAPRSSIGRRYMPEAFLKVLDVVDPSLGEGGLVKGERFLKAIFGGLETQRLEDLPVPLLVVATDYWARAPVVFERGELMPIVQASTAMPGLFTPVKLDGKLLVDGGLTNPVPFDVLHDRCDLVVAVDAIGERTRTAKTPDALDVLFGSFQVMEKAIAQAKAEAKPPHIYVTLEIADIPTLEWYRADEIYAKAAPAKAELKKLLGEVLAGQRRAPAR